MMKRKIILRLKYYRKYILNFFGYCSICGEKGNKTSKGRLICPYCGK